MELAEKIDESDSDEEEYHEPRMVLPGDESFIDDLDSAFQDAHQSFVGQEAANLQNDGAGP